MWEGMTEPSRNRFNTRPLPVHLQRHRVSVAIAILQMLGGAKALEFTVDHDGQTAAEDLTLLHTVRGEDDRPLTFSDDGEEAVPKEAP